MIKRQIRKFIKSKVNTQSVDQVILNLEEDYSDNEKLLIRQSPGGWSIDSKVTEFLISLIKSIEPKKVVEIGAGYSTLVLHYVLNQINQPYQVQSIEQNSDWFKIPETILTLFPERKIEFEIAPVKFTFGYFGFYARYSLMNESIISSQIDLQIVDGPQYFFGREGGLDFTYSKLRPGALILMDDAERYIEQCVIYKWLKVYKGLELIFYNESFGDKGLAIFRVNSPLKRRFSLSVFSLGLSQGIKRLLNVSLNNPAKKAGY
jgi:hypothetical protein